MPNGKLHKGPPKRLSNYIKAVKLEEGLTMARLRGKMKFKQGKKALERSVKDHIGKLIDRVEPIDAFINIGLAYLGYEAFHTWKGALIGPIAYKLATTQGGTPPVSQISGLAILGILGVAAIPSATGFPLLEQIAEKINPVIMDWASKQTLEWGKTGFPVLEWLATLLK